MNCPKCGMYNAYGRQECTECGHSFMPKPIELSDDESTAALERESQPYYFTATPENEDNNKEKKPLLSPAVTDSFGKVGSFFRNIVMFTGYLWQVLKKHRTAFRIVLAIFGIILIFIISRCVSGVNACIEEERAYQAWLASMSDVVEEDPTPSIVSMSDTWVLNKENDKLILNRDGTFSDEHAGTTGTWTHDIDKIYFTNSDSTLSNRTYRLIGDYLFLDCETVTLTRNCNESETVEMAGLWISGSGYAMSLNEDGTHGAADEEYGKYANAWAYENGVLAMVTIINNVEYFDYYGCQINGDTMERLGGTVYVREGGGIALGGGDIEFSAGYVSEK